MSRNDSGSPPPSITIWSPPEPGAKLMAGTYLKGWEDFKFRVEQELQRFERHKVKDEDRKAKLDYNTKIAKLEMEGWGEAQVYEDGLTEKIKAILEQRIEKTKKEIESTPTNTPASSVPASTTSS